MTTFSLVGVSTTLALLLQLLIPIEIALASQNGPYAECLKKSTTPEESQKTLKFLIDLDKLEASKLSRDEKQQVYNSICVNQLDPKLIYESMNSDLRQILQTIMDRSPGDDVNCFKIRLFVYGSVRKFRDKRAYSKLNDGAIVAKIHGNTIQEKSKENIVSLKEEVGKLTEDEKILYKEILNLPMTLKHNTNAWSEIQASGELLSNDELVRRKVKFRDMSEADTLLGSTDFVFFKLFRDDEPALGRGSVKDNPMASAYGRQTLVFKSDQLIERGWVYFEDQFAGREADVDINKTIRFSLKTISRIIDASFQERQQMRDLGTRFTFHDEHGKEKTYVYWHSDRYFYAHDIPIGIGLSLIAFLRNFSPEIRKEIATSPNRQAILSKILEKAYHIQALIPETFKVLPEEVIKVYDLNKEIRVKRY